MKRLRVGNIKGGRDGEGERRWMGGREGVRERRWMGGNEGWTVEVTDGLK